MYFDKYPTSRIVVAIATLVGAFSTFPEKPTILKKLGENELVQWALVFVLIYQGGAGQDIELAAALTVAAFIVSKLLKYWEMSRA